jgi:choline-glycine betaine transporter
LDYFVKKLNEIEEVGWIFFAVVFVLLLGPGAWISWNVTSDVLASTLVRAGIMLFIAAFGSGLVSWGVNEVLFRLKKKRDRKRQKALKKTKKRKKKKSS